MKTSRMHSQPSPPGPPPRRGALRVALLLGALLATGAIDRPERLRGRAPPRQGREGGASPSEGTAEVVVVTTGTPQFTARVADGGPRLIVDIEGADVAGAPGAITKGNALVGGVMTQGVQQAGQPHRPAWWCNLAHPAEYRISPEPGALRVCLAPAEKTAPHAAPKPAGPQPGRARAPRWATCASITRPASIASSSISRGGVEFSRVQRGRGGTLIELRGVRLPDSLQRKLDTSAFGGPVRAVSTYRKQERSGSGGGRHRARRRRLGDGRAARGTTW